MEMKVVHGNESGAWKWEMKVVHGITENSSKGSL